MRQQYRQIREQFFTGRVLFLLGPRGAGKRAFLNDLLQEVSPGESSVVWLDGDHAADRQRARALKADTFRGVHPGVKVLVLAEIHRLPEIETLVTSIASREPDLQLLILSSSRSESVTRIQEVLTGRRATFHILPPAMAEGPADLQDVLRFGRYPIGSDTLSQVLRDTLREEVLSTGEVRKPAVLDDLLLLLARNLGRELIIRDLSLSLSLDPKTVLRYIGLLEKAFLVFRIPCWYGYIENEVTASRKLYFYDNGIRNAILDAFQPAPARTDMDALWENFLVSERLKQLNARRERVGVYYWRSTQRQEVSYLEKRDEGIQAWQFNWDGLKPVRFPKTFVKHYGPTSMEEVRPDSYFGFLEVDPEAIYAPVNDPQLSDAADAQVRPRREQSSIRPADEIRKQPPSSPPKDSTDVASPETDVTAQEARNSNPPVDPEPDRPMTTSMFRNVLADLRKKSGD